MTDAPEIPQPVRELTQQLAIPRPMRRGSLSIRYMKCNKPGCLCAKRDEARHGPYASVVRGIAGQTRSRQVAPEQVDVVRRQIEAGRQFRRQVEAYWTACERWADTQLEAPQAADPSATKKGASPAPSWPRSKPKSTR